MYWQYEKAKSCFSEVFSKALGNSPQRITGGDEEVEADMDTLNEWLTSK